MIISFECPEKIDDVTGKTFMVVLNKWNLPEEMWYENENGVRMDIIF